MELARVDLEFSTGEALLDGYSEICLASKKRRRYLRRIQREDQLRSRSVLLWLLRWRHCAADRVPLGKVESRA